MVQSNKKTKGLVPLVMAVLAFLFLGFGHAKASSIELTTPAKYVIQNVETGLFMRFYRKDEGIGGSIHKFYVTFGSPTTTDATCYLWTCEKSSNGGYTFKSEQAGKEQNVSGQYLEYGIGKTLTANDGYYYNCYGSTGAEFFVYTNPYDQSSMTVSHVKPGQDAKTENTQSWYSYLADKMYWLCTTKDNKLDQGSHYFNGNYWYLSNYRFFTYADLYAKAQRLGYGKGTGETLTEAGSTEDANYATLVNWLVSKEASNADNNTFTSTLLDKTTYVLLVNRRYGTYLAMDTKGNYYSADAISSDCLWMPSRSGNSYQFLHYGNAKALKINGSMQLTLKPSADADISTVSHTDAQGNSSQDSTGYFRISDGKTIPTFMVVQDDATKAIIESEDAESASHPFLGTDWSFEPYDFDDKVEATATRETSIKDSLFFRLQNEGYSLANKGSGWLVDVDRTDMRHFDKLLSTDYTDNSLVDVASIRKTRLSSTGSRGKATAASLWHLIRVAKANNNEPPIGITGSHKKDIYCIKNANSGKYLGMPDTKYDGKKYNNKFIPLVDQAHAALFWLDDIGRGQYAIAMRDPGDPNSDKLKGYLQIKAPATPSSPNDSDFYRAGLQLGSTTQPTAGSVGAWSILQATSVHAKTGTSLADDDKALSDRLFPDVTEDDGLRYVTAYYPFDVIPTSPYAKAFRAEWADDTHSAVRFVECHGVIPAYKGALVIVPNEKKHNSIEYNVFAATNKNSEYDNDILTGIVESEQMDFKMLGDQKKDITALRQQIYILTTETENSGKPGYNTVALGLYHPDDEYLMENRCFIYDERQQSPAKALAVTFALDGAAGISELPTTPGRNDNIWYDLTGRRVDHPAKGLYIHNGHKVAVR